MNYFTRTFACFGLGILIALAAFGPTLTPAKILGVFVGSLITSALVWVWEKSQ